MPSSLLPHPPPRLSTRALACRLDQLSPELTGSSQRTVRAAFQRLLLAEDLARNLPVVPDAITPTTSPLDALFDGAEDTG